MTVIAYLPLEGCRSDSLIKTIKKSSPKMRLEIYHSLPALEERFRRSVLDVTVALLAFSRQDEIIELYSLYDFLCDVKIIMILPDSEFETVKQAHRLRPRYIGWMDGDFHDVGLVIERMLEHSEMQTD